VWSPVPAGLPASAEFGRERAPANEYRLAHREKQRENAENDAQGLAAVNLRAGDRTSETHSQPKQRSRSTKLSQGRNTWIGGLTKKTKFVESAPRLQTNALMPAAFLCFGGSGIERQSAKEKRAI
jgi:hypothetical protein